MGIVENFNIGEKGFIDLDVDKSLDIVEEINRMRKEKNAVILAHFYQEGEIQDIADFVGDSLGLSQQAAGTSADVILFAGVHFMAETAKILAPEKKVLIPDLQAGCSLAESCPPEEFSAFKARHADHTVISYVNTTAEIKALTDIVCTSTNALEIVRSLPEDEKIIFAPGAAISLTLYDTGVVEFTQNSDTLTITGDGNDFLFDTSDGGVQFEDNISVDITPSGTIPAYIRETSASTNTAETALVVDSVSDVIEALIELAAFLYSSASFC